MGFTNLYDDTFPADTELANLIGANLRQVRLDVQQRMAVISGLDASKPAFSADVQPANWNGILFFATDTGRIYQFTNPNFVDITSSFLAVNPPLRDTSAHNNTGNTSQNLLSTLTMTKACSTTQVFRITTITNQVAYTSGSDFLTVKINTTPITSSGMANAAGGVTMVTIIGCNTGSASAQVWASYIGSTTNNVLTGTGNTFTSAINTASPPFTFNAFQQSGNNANSNTLELFMVEFL